MHSRRRHAALLGLILAALIGVALLALPGSPAYRPPVLGLDLRGGFEEVLQAAPTGGHRVTRSDLDRSIAVMRERIDRLGIGEPSIARQGSDQIVVQLAGVHDPAAAAAVIGKTAQLELYDLEHDLTGPSLGLDGEPVAEPSLHRLLTRAQPLLAQRAPAQWYLFGPRRHLVAGPKPARAELLARHGGQVPAGDELLALPARTVVVTCGAGSEACPGVGAAPARRFFYLFEHDPARGIPELTGADLKLSGTRADFDPTGAAVVLIRFTEAGSRKFEQVTRELWARGSLRGTPQHFAIVLDDELRTFPRIDYTDPALAGGIGGSAQITGVDPGEARELALVLQTGALPIPFTPIERTDVSATLGKDSLDQALRAAVVGLAAVAVFLLARYRFLGLIAVAGLAVYCAFLYAAVLLLGVTLTLPGFAGVILTIGVAADANVVVFERIREELRAGRSARAAVDAGYAKGFRTILDANVVTAIAALVLFAVATAQVKGFALMLLVGTVVSLLTAVAATRAMLGLLAGFPRLDDPRLLGATARAVPRRVRVDFMRHRRSWLALSAAALCLCAVSLGTRGLAFGIDFEGGTQLTFRTAGPQPIPAVRAAIAHAGAATGAVVQGRGTEEAGGYRSFQVRTRALGGGELTALERELTTAVGAVAPGATTVSSTFGRQVTRLAAIAVLASLLLIVLYTTARFGLEFAVPVILAMLHDLVLTIGAYSLTGFEVTTATIAAVLTVLGYSIYDTIIVFDRIRENVPRMRRSPFAAIANASLAETIGRSLATTLITLLPVACLAIFGGATLKDFAFAILIGVASGAYSSIFVATPLLALWKEREPRYAKLKAEAASLPDG